MSIETLLEAARFLEWQAQQQQKTREENELLEKVRSDREAEQKRVEVMSPVQAMRTNHVGRGEEACPEHHPSPAAPPPLPPPLPVAVIPIPMVTASPAAPPPPPLAPPPATALSPAVATPRLSPPSKEPHHSPPAPPPPVPPPPPHRTLLGPQVKVEPTTPPQSGSPKQQLAVQSYPGSIIAPPFLSQPNAGSRPAGIDDAKTLDQKRRPGGRAHLKECFETLKRNIPSVDEKKTSNLSVLRSALRYIQTLKRKEKEYEHEMERLAREKIATQQRLAELKNELSQWMDVMEIDRVLRQTVQPEDDQASTSTASEGEDNIDQDIEDERLPVMPGSLPKVPPLRQPEILKAILPQHLSVQKAPQLPALPSSGPPLSTQAPPPIATAPPQGVATTHAHIVTAPSMQPTVIAHAATASHASVIQAVNHVIQAGAKHIAHIAPSSSNSVQLAPAGQPIGHITVHPVAHLSQHLPTIYPQPVAVSQPAVMSHIAHTLSHAQVNGTASSQPTAAMVGKQTAQVVTHHPQLMSQTVLNPVTMVTMPSFPVSTLKLA
ncbi:max-binding protein MNT isoform X2 [Lepisosteus oculatus]|uniref:max-binding protein MNT isoform X2 n=1 Tax=Lepisosteus oculatus TaxID=7918 RepID=UPI003719696A